MHGNRIHFRPKISRQVGGGDRCENRACGRGCRRIDGEHGTPLQIAGVGRGDLLAVALRVRLRPGAPRFVGRGRITRAREHLYLVRTSIRSPPNRAPGRDRASVAHVGFVGATARWRCGQGEELARIAGRANETARRFAEERGHLSGGGAGQ